MGVFRNQTECNTPYVAYYSIAMYGLLFVVYAIVSVLFIKHPNSFHPFFVISFFLILLAYTTSSFLLFSLNFYLLLYKRDSFFGFFQFIYVYATNYTQPVVVLTLLERLVATILVNKYENTKNWLAYTVAQGFCVTFVVAMTLFSSKSEFLTNVQITISVVICIVLIILFTLNRKMTENSQARLTLTTRYQLAENIKALRIFVPFLLMDSFISIMFLITRLTISVDRAYDLVLCVTSPTYIPLFLIIRTVAIIIQILMAISVIYQHESMKFWKHLRKKRKVTVDDLHTIKTRPQIQIRNVLGKNIFKLDTAENYFAQLQTQWDKNV